MESTDEILSHARSNGHDHGTPRAGSTRRRFLLSRGLAALALSAAALAAPAVFAGPPVLFKGLVSGTLVPVNETTFSLTGSGIATQLGLAAHGGPATITSVDPGTGIITDTLVETFIAANGDQLVVLCTQTATPVANARGVYEATDEWTVVGGTGRFAGAKGSGSGDTYVDLGAGTYVKQLKGSLTLRN